MPEAINRTWLVCRKFMDLVRTYSCDEVIAVAISHTREAENRNHRLNRFRHEVGPDVRVTSGREETGLICLGISSGIILFGKTVLFIDLGGGSTEIANDDETRVHLPESQNIGAIRLFNQYFKAGEENPESPVPYRQIQRQIQNAIANEVREIRNAGFDNGIGSSGTMINLAEIANR